MNSFELNKIIGAILGTLLLVMGLGFVAEAVYKPIAGGPGYALPEPEGEDGHGGGGEAAPEEPAMSLAMLLASADAAAGEKAFKKCASCHDVSEGGANKTGPALYSIVGRPIASHEGFAYSDAMIEHGKEDGAWTYELLSAFLANPKAEVPGTKMSFAGLKKDKERADVLAYLQTLSGSPVPFPEEEAAPAAEAAPAEQPAETPAPTEQPAAAPAETPAPAEQPAAAPAETPAPAEQPAATETPAQPAAEQPAATPAEQPAAPAEAPKPMETPAAPASN